MLNQNVTRELVIWCSAICIIAACAMSAEAQRPGSSTIEQPRVIITNSAPSNCINAPDCLSFNDEEKVLDVYRQSRVMESVTCSNHSIKAEILSIQQGSAQPSSFVDMQLDGTKVELPSAFRRPLVEFGYDPVQSTFTCFQDYLVIDMKASEGVDGIRVETPRLALGLETREVRIVDGLDVLKLLNGEELP